MTTNLDLKQLIEEVEKGDENAFRVIFEKESGRLFKYALSRTRDRDTALDLTQETFIALWKSISSSSFKYKGEEAFLGFVFIILKRKIAKHYKETEKESLKLKLEKNDVYEEEHEDYRHLISLLDKMSSNYQDAIKLRYWGELSFAEIGQTLGMNENTARVLHHRAIKKLQDLF